MQNYDRILDSINSLTVYKNIANDEIIRILKRVLTDEDNLEALAELTDFLVNRAEEKGFCGNLFKNYIRHLIFSDENVFTLACENDKKVENTTLYALAKADIDALSNLAENNRLVAVDFYGKRYDMGDKLGIMQANVEIALRHPEIGDSFRAYLKELSKTL